ncbi:MAG TPA: glycosyltransferase, partial [Bacteroidales bacterium]
MKTAIVILNWNTRRHLETFLPFLVKYSVSPEVKIIVADNASEDDSVAFLKTNYPQIDLIQLDRNYGFAEGYNRALKQVEAEYYVILNS